MAKEPYNLFRTAGSTLPGGDQYDDLMVILKAIVQRYGNAHGELHVPQDLLMYVDRDEALNAEDRFNHVTGTNELVFSITRMNPKDRPADIPEGDVSEEVSKYEEIGRKLGKGCGVLLWIIVIFSFLYLCFHIMSWFVAGVTS